MEYFSKFKELTDKYLPSMGEGETMATQITTAVCKLVYKWFNDGDVYDNTYFLSGWCNDLSSYANWLYENVYLSREILEDGKHSMSDGEYEEHLMELADMLLTEENLEAMNQEPARGTIYNCDGPFVFEDQYDDEEEDY